MLVLTRKIGETVFIGDGIRLSILDIKGSRVQIGIDAPPDVRVDREELRLRMQKFDEPHIVGGK